MISFLEIYYNSYYFSLILFDLLSFYLVNYSLIENAISLIDSPVYINIWIELKFLHTCYSPIAFLNIS